MKSVFAARQQYWSGKMTKHEFNQVVAKSVFAKWLPIAADTVAPWRWLCELSCYLELKHLGYE